tara:strand:+ start:1004 stop:1357 length:354 start_codon:yes stop_codon:yes gene_type:complete
MIGIYLTNNSQALAPNWCSSWRPRHEGRKEMAAADSVAQTLVRSSESIRMPIKERNLLPDTSTKELVQRPERVVPELQPIGRDYLNPYYACIKKTGHGYDFVANDASLILWPQLVCN